ncbi:methyltransferase family protein [Chloroflexota bacterium]
MKQNLPLASQAAKYTTGRIDIPGDGKIKMSTARDDGGQRERLELGVIWLVWLFTLYFIFSAYAEGTVRFYLGFSIAAIGLIAYTLVLVSFVTTSINYEPITKGLYRYSRHPMYVTQVMAFIGIAISFWSMFFLLFTVGYMVLVFLRANHEEQNCIELYGKAYREYMKKTPKWIGIPKPG